MKYITNWQYSAAILVLSILFTSFNGCGKTGHEVYPATGKILYQGKPLGNAQVTFHPTDPSGFVAAAITESDGTFSLLTTGAEKNGAIAGEYNVLISKNIVADNDITTVTDTQEKTNSPTSIMDVPVNPQYARRPKMTAAIPEKYAQPDKPLIKVTVAKKQNNYLFELDDK
ncbi:MAG: hypothetical protein LBC74_11110 [Planctomycetaceae bacterium]|jgi:hypothetical protein|nr:hypothetical protein [Planctomycetaceae bacterium]